MSYSFSYRGSLQSIRREIKDSWADNRDVRVAHSVVHTELDAIDLVGGTHAIVTASGHAGNHNIAVNRDMTAESEFKKDEDARKFDEYLEHGKKLGVVIERTDGTIAFNVPERSKRQLQSKGSTVMASDGGDSAQSPTPSTRSSSSSTDTKKSTS